MTLATTGTIPGQVPGGAALSNVLICMNVPTHLEEADVKRLLGPFGDLKAFNMPRDSEGQSKGTIVFEFDDTLVASGALSCLNGLALGEIKLVVQRVPPEMAETLLRPRGENEEGDGEGGGPAQDGSSGAAAAATEAGATEAAAGSDVQEATPSTVLMLSNMLTAEELASEQEIEEVREDVKEEGAKFGTVKAVEIPRPGQEDCGKIFLLFALQSEAVVARNALDKRPFGESTVKAEFYSADLFAQKFAPDREKAAAEADVVD